MRGKVVLITGGSSGIGEACARVFGQAGARVAITGRDAEALALAKVRLEATVPELLTIRADAALEAENRRMVEETLRHFGRLDIFIANAGISMRAPFEDLDLAVFRQVMDINFMGAVYGVKYALPHILASRGSVIGISSINGHRGTPWRSAYTASKYALNGFLESLRTEVMDRGVHVLVVSPGFTASNIRRRALTADGQSQGESPREEGRMMTAEAVAEATLRAAFRRQRDLVLTRQGRLAVFLNKWMPGLMDRIVYRHMARERDAPVAGSGGA